MSGINIDGFCIQTVPYQHRVTINGIPRGIMKGKAIRKLYVDRGLPVPEHFASYK